MSRSFRGPRTRVLAAVSVAALPAGFAVILMAFGGSPTAAVPAAARQAVVAPAPAAAAGHASSSPSQAAGVPVQTTASAAVLPAAAMSAPPAADGIRRGNVGSAHSPQIQQQLSVSPAGPPPADAGALGVDVAGYQHPGGAAIDWNQVAAAGYRFAFVKATEGDCYGNPYYASDLARAKAAGLYAADYHFAIPDVSSGASQADYAIRSGGYVADGRTLPLALDIEYDPYGAECYGLTAARMVSWLRAFAGEAQRLTGQQPVIYTTADWWRTCTGNSPAFGADQLWIAAFRNGSPPMPAGWGNWTFWQYTSSATVPGISTRTDVSYFLSSAVRLLDPGAQHSAPGTQVTLQVTSLNAAGGQAPQFTASNLPPRLTISASGQISGTIPPKAKGTWKVTVTAVNASGGSGSVSFRWTVSADSQPSATPSASPSPSPQTTPASPPGSPSPTGSPTTSPTPPSSPAASPSDSPSPSASPTDSPSPSQAASSTAAASPPASPPASPSDSPSPTPTAASPTAPVPPSPSLTPPSPAQPAPPSGSASQAEPAANGVRPPARRRPLPAGPTTEMAHDREA
jgi:GH25 family lysozyme M1 (1,4-beta-N-acetylmuramidase)